MVATFITTYKKDKTTWKKKQKGKLKEKEKEKRNNKYIQTKKIYTNN